jgi:multimeric flavodoxin WrbA
MKKVTAFVGSAHKKITHSAVRQFLDELQSHGDVDSEIVTLSEYRLGTCRGCRLCCEKGEESCPIKDDRDVLIEKMMASDGVVFASPNYSFQVSALMKIFLDRLGFVFHRPRFFGKTFTCVVTQGIYGGEKIVKYLDFVGNGLGFNTVKGTCHRALDPMTEKEKQRRDRDLARQSSRFYEKMMKPPYPAPSLIKLMVFRMSRTGMRLGLDGSNLDYRHYNEKGWFESEYFYPTRLGPMKKLAGNLFDSIQARSLRRRKRASTELPQPNGR